MVITDKDKIRINQQSAEVVKIFFDTVYPKYSVIVLKLESGELITVDFSKFDELSKA